MMASENKKAMNSKTFVILASVIVIGGLGSFFWWLNVSQFEETENATLIGHVHPVSARVPGTVKQVLVQDNQFVKQGQLIATLDSKGYEIALSQAEHNLKVTQAQAKTAYSNIGFTEKQALAQITQAKGTIGTSSSGITQSKQSVEEATASVQQAQHVLQEQDAQYQKALNDYQRYKRADPEAISEQQLDAATTNLKTAEAARNSANAALAQAQARLEQSRSNVKNNLSRLTQSKGVLQGAQAQLSQLDVIRNQYESAKASIDTALDTVEQAKLNLAYTQIVAPTSGRIGRKTVEVGQRIQAGEPLMSVVGSDVWIVANYKETQLKKMRLGQPVEVHVDAFPDHPFKGVVQSFSPASGAQFALLPPENATGNFTKIVQRIPVKILLNSESIKNYADLLMPGMSTVVAVKVSAPGKE